MRGNFVHFTNPNYPSRAADARLIQRPGVAGRDIRALVLGRHSSRQDLRSCSPRSCLEVVT